VVAGGTDEQGRIAVEAGGEARESAVAYGLGVDLGTTYTAAAAIRGGRAEVATLGTRSLEIPSVVLLRSDGEMLIGEAAERRSQTEPDRFAREFKRRMGDPTPVLLGGSPFSAHALTSRLLKGVVKVVSDREGGPPDHIVVTCPANWGDYKRDLLEQAVQQADVGSVSIATEPEAAAVHYATTTRVAPGEIVAVYDLGGGTFDAAVLRNTGAGFELLGDPRGIEQLGGVYFDEAVFRWVIAHLGETFTLLDPDDPGAMAAVSRLRRDCVEAKEALSWDTDTAIPVALPTHRTEVRLTRREFEDMIRPTLADTLDAMRRSLASADVRPEQVSSVLLVVGSSRIPLVGEMLVAELKRPVAIDVHPKHAVALGAAHLAAADTGAIAVPAEAPATLDPPVVTRAGRTTVTGPAVAGAAAAGAAAGAVAAGAPQALPGAGGAGTTQPFPEAGPGGRLPRTGEPGAMRPPSEDPGAIGEPEPPRRGRVLAVAAVVAAVVVAVAVALFALGGDDEPAATGDGPDGTEADTDDTGGNDDTETDTEAGPVAVSVPPDIPQGPPLAASTLAYTQVDGTFWNVWLIEADGSNPRALTRFTEDKARLPVVSPDRTAVAYTVETAAGWELRVTDSQGTANRTLTDQIVTDGRATWSPDGGRLAFVADPDGVQNVYVFDLATGDMTQLTDNPQDVGDPAWSPDGATIAYWVQGAESGQDIWTIPAEGGTPVQLTQQPGDDADPAWSPTGNEIAFSSTRNGDWDIFAMNADGRDQRQLTTDAADDQDPAWSPDGAFIAFETKRDSTDRPDDDWAEIYKMLPDGRDQVNVTNRDQLDIHPAWGLAPPG
jgi:cell division ATPase FtsA